MSLPPTKNNTIVPPAEVPVDTSQMKNWYVGCILSNPSFDLNHGSPSDVARRAIEIADEVVKFLNAEQTVPEKIDPPSEQELSQWEQKIDARERVTLPAIPKPRKLTVQGIAAPTNPPPAEKRVQSDKFVPSTMYKSEPPKHLSGDRPTVGMRYAVIDRSE